ncbi:HAD family phosphatase [Deinococcus psychrotolerans]|uniref:HAD family phosphatase n=1 Tax=Deinococcus psychrotolerans TaxID=2489213 RepID=A0A3G8YDJ3_9DEIO|nr:Cof-type HAD-IIB family hydrolase [Deinococcus psychrotolerans]AZI43392.1 HAD family phosphatase [Deinococcus psychrotolerans]
MTFKLVASDLDGTLLSSAGEVSVRSRAALAGVQAAGGVVVLITGRPSRMVLPLASALGLSGHVICSNGAAIHRLPGGEPEDLRTLSPEVLRCAVPALRLACPDLGLALEWGSGMQAETAYRAAPDSVSDVLNFLDAGHPVLKVMARSATLSPAQLTELINARCGDELHASLSGAPFAEIAARGVHKSAALARLCAGLGIRAGEVLAFGDAPNDLPLLSWAGCGVAVANAVPEVLAVADQVTLNNDEDGVAALLERLLAAGKLGS